MTTELPEPDDDFDRKLLADFARVGWAVVGIPADDEGPSYAFSIGLHRAHSHPEVILIGLPFEASQQFINAVGATVSKGGRYEADHRYDDLIEGHVATFVSVDRSHYKAYLGAAGWFYRDPALVALRNVIDQTKRHHIKLQLPNCAHDRL